MTHERCFLAERKRPVWVCVTCGVTWPCLEAHRRAAISGRARGLVTRSGLESSDMQKPNQAQAQVAPAEALDPTRKYVVELIGMDERVGPHKDDKTGELKTSIIWKFNMWDLQDGVAVLDIDGHMYEKWRFTPDGTWSNPKTGKKSLTRQFIEALVGRPVTDDEVSRAIDRGIAQVLKGKRAVADLEATTLYDDEGNQVDRVTIARLQPFRPRTAANPARQPAAAAPAQPAPAARAPASTPTRERGWDDPSPPDDHELPW